MNKVLLKILLTTVIVASGYTLQSQILISLLLGDKLNSGGIEFGLDGGINFLNQSNTPGAEYLPDWNLGFYFDFKLRNPHLFVHTGVIVKSKMGASGLDPYDLGNNFLDSTFIGGTVDRKINYFNVPAMLRYRLPNFFHIEGGIQLGLRYTGFDVFRNNINTKNDLQYLNDVKENFTRLDAGLLGGIGYKFLKGEGITISARYFYGLVDVNKELSGSQANSAIYLTASIPIGKGKAEQESQEN